VLDKDAKAAVLMTITLPSLKGRVGDYAPSARSFCAGQRR
jgi:hypothetical protein